VAAFVIRYNCALQKELRPRFEVTVKTDPVFEKFRWNNPLTMNRMQKSNAANLDAPPPESLKCTGVEVLHLELRIEDVC
jgi:hypothetical protein